MNIVSVGRGGQFLASDTRAPSSLSLGPALIVFAISVSTAFAGRSPPMHDISKKASLFFGPRTSRKEPRTIGQSIGLAGDNELCQEEIITLIEAQESLTFCRSRSNENQAVWVFSLFIILLSVERAEAA